MFKRRTLFVLGAGASYEVKMPLGVTLATTIADKLDIHFESGRFVGTGDEQLYYEITRSFPSSSNAYLLACWRLRDGVRYSNSIDDFLDIHSTDALMNKVGKAAIILTIIEAEAQSPMKHVTRTGLPGLNASALEGTWYMKFMRVLTRNVQKENVAEIFDNVAFISFNYDRSLEYFLLHALAGAYGLNTDEAANVFEKLKIIHPYGVAAELHSSLRPRGVPFGAPPHVRNYASLVSELYTYTDRTLDKKVIDEIHNEVSRSQAIIFLGFGFHDQNIEMLRPSKPLKPLPIIGTARGMSDEDVKVVRAQIATFFSRGGVGDIVLRNGLTCAGLFDEYAKSIAG